MTSAKQLVECFTSNSLKLAVAESLTGGLLAGAITDVPGASQMFLGSITAYQSDIKQHLLGVSGQLLANQGAIDPEVAAQMAVGVRSGLARHCSIPESQVVGVATTGVAGPDSQDNKPTGTVFIAIAGIPMVGEVVYAHHFVGTRSEIRQQTVQAALDHLGEHFSGPVG